MASFAVVLPAAGASTRFSENKRKKVFLELKGRAVWIRAAEHFVNRDDVAQTIIAIAAADMEWFKEKYRPNLAFMDVEIVEGGRTRAETVRNALARVRADLDFVAVHDAARPLLTKRWIDAVFGKAEECGAAIPAIRVTQTLKRADSDALIRETVSRDGLWQAQTPQVFRRRLLLDAYAQYGDSSATDEAQVVESAGTRVAIVEGSPMNLKITRRDDFRMAQAVLDVLPREQGPRALHPFKDDERGLLFD